MPRVLDILTRPDQWKRVFYRFRDSVPNRHNLESELDASIELVYFPRAISGLAGPSDRPLRVLYVAMRYDYGNLRRGLSFEENNFFHTLVSMGFEVIRFDFPTILRRHGRARMNAMLLETVYRYDPDLMFTVLFRDELDKAVIKEISEQTRTVTVNWFCDDHWRFESYSRHWAPAFNWVTTTAKSALRKYEELGYRNVILTQWACNHFLYRKLNLPHLYDVTFVGQPHGDRRLVIKRLRKAGIDVRTWGYGWKQGKVTQREMVQIFNQTKINLNLSNASVPGTDQIKGRNFEIPGCGGFLLTGYAPHLEEYYDIGKEIVCFDDIDDLMDKIRYYLVHDDEREMIALAGYQRTIRDHTYDKRFHHVFSHIGLR